MIVWAGAKFDFCLSLFFGPFSVLKKLFRHTGGAIFFAGGDRFVGEQPSVFCERQMPGRLPALTIPRDGTCRHHPTNSGSRPLSSLSDAIYARENGGS